MTGSIFSNIVGSNYHLTLKDAQDAIKMAGLDEDVTQMPMGMQTVVPDGGGTLSGGQRQRLVIARALVNKPKILFFDEATSALDNRTQEIVSQSLKGLKATRIVIAHRLSTIIDCDRIIVMKDGQILEEGTYEELMKKAGLFSELAKRQLA
jgi:ATP-binding cassette subfamily C protein